jgi:hypothetical protein
MKGGEEAEDGKGVEKTLLCAEYCGGHSEAQAAVPFATMYPPRAFRGASGLIKESHTRPIWLGLGEQVGWARGL